MNITRTSLGLLLTLSACSKSGTVPVHEPSNEAIYAPSAPAPVEENLAPSVASPEPGTTMPPAPGLADAVSAPVGEVAAAPAPETAGMGNTAALSDGQILKVTETVNSGEIEQAKLARTKAKNAEVKAFAAHMISEHTKANQESKSLAKKAKLQPEDSPAASEVGAKGASTLETLKATDKDGFDRAYVDAQVTQHQDVLTLISEQLLPSATDEQLKAQLEKTRGLVEGHLAKARDLQAKLGVVTASAVP